MLLAREGVSPIPDQKAVDVYYADHQEEFGDMPRGHADLEIRNTLTADLATKYRERERAYLQQLRAAAGVVRI
jgi:hypothetical protein